MIKKFLNMIRWARITKAGENGQQFYTQQMEYQGKTVNGVIIFPYGTHANVPADNLALMMAIQGNPDNRAAVAWDAKNRPNLEEGEVAVYSPVSDSYIIMRTNGDIDIKAGTVTIDGNLTVTGATTLSDTVTSNGKDISDTHIHSGSPTAPLGAVSDTGTPT